MPWPPRFGRFLVRGRRRARPPGDAGFGQASTVALTRQAGSRARLPGQGTGRSLGLVSPQCRSIETSYQAGSPAPRPRQATTRPAVAFACSKGGRQCHSQHPNRLTQRPRRACGRGLSVPCVCASGHYRDAVHIRVIYVVPAASKRRA